MKELIDSDGSSSYDEDGSGSDPISTQTNEDKTTNIAASLAARETTDVNRFKRLVYGVLLLACTATSLGTHYTIKREEMDKFETKLATYADELLDGAERSIQVKFAELKSLSHSLTSHMLESQWPNATFPQFDIRTVNDFDESGSRSFVLAPIVSFEDKGKWEEYAWAQRAEAWTDGFFPGEIPKRIHPFFGDDEYDIDEIETYVPVWQVGPSPTNSSNRLLDLYSHPSFRRMIDDAVEVEHMLLSEVVDVSFLSSQNPHTRGSTHGDDPRSFGLQPIRDGFEEDSVIVGFLFVIFSWSAVFRNILGAEATGVLSQVFDSCGPPFSYQLEGATPKYLGVGIQHDPKFDHLVQTRSFAEFARFDGESNGIITHCEYTMAVYPTDELKALHYTTDRVLLPFGIVFLFGFTALVFTLYNFMVEKRQTAVMASATRTTALVSSLFPQSVQERILNNTMGATTEDGKDWVDPSSLFPRRKVKDFLRRDETNSTKIVGGSRPIADLFASASIIFADLVGFTAWSSVRDPSQVFQLLETLYNAFDEQAIKRRVYKVETIGDCWVGACGLPEVRKDHAVQICRFADDIVRKTGVLVKQLELELGPDTADLGIRIGIHSGPVTAGVLRGERARFQLFGDTVNTSARMESTGKKNQIQLSKETRNLLVDAGKGSWAVERDDKVVAKGKGEMVTFWLGYRNLHSQQSGSSNGDSSDEETYGFDDDDFSGSFSLKTQRLVKWNAELLLQILKDIAKSRQAHCVNPDPEHKLNAAEATILSDSCFVVDELTDVIELPEFQPFKSTPDITQELHPSVEPQVICFIKELFYLYRDNPFHNFEHASHVTMSVIKLLNRIAQADNLGDATEATLHDQTYGLTSDPLTQFVAVFSGLIHDCDHQGVPNATLVKEGDSVAKLYHNKSPAEQQSVNCAWKILQKDCYRDLRRAIYCTTEELSRFRQLLVACVMATDISDTTLSTARKQRWNIAFSGEKSLTVNKGSASMVRNRKANIILEHLIQASDVAHTMQHWHVYRKWNQNLFYECMAAYEAGRSKQDPADGWYRGELGFFDFYIIPLAKKLAECGVFGVSSDEYLNYATSNRAEWETRGEGIVQEMKAEYVNWKQNKSEN